MESTAEHSKAVQRLERIAVDSTATQCKGRRFMIHVVMIAFNNPEQTLTRWTRDVFPGLGFSGHPHKVTVVDNSSDYSPLLAEKFGENYLWQEGKNLMYGPSINLAVKRYPESDYVLYVCTRHGRSLDSTWIQDLILPMDNDSTIGGTGHLRGSNSPEGVAHALNAPWIKDRFRFVDEAGNGWVPQHLQGGVFAARTKLMLEFPYPDDIQTLYTDHFITWAIMKAGHKCWDVQTILSVWRENLNDRQVQGKKFVHAENYV